jgi:hypothetical protein
MGRGKEKVERRERKRPPFLSVYMAETLGQRNEMCLGWTDESTITDDLCFCFWDQGFFREKEPRSGTQIVYGRDGQPAQSAIATREWLETLDEMFFRFATNISRSTQERKGGQVRFSGTAKTGYRL